MPSKEENRWAEWAARKDPDEVKKEKIRIMKNILVISAGFLFNFTAFQGLSRLQSSLHIDEGMGTINSAILYGALVLSCLFLPKIIIRYIGYKWTIPAAFIGYILWMAANGYGVWWTMTPASIIVGLCAAPLWTAQCSYFTLEAGRYAALSKETEEAVVTRFFGIFFCFFQMSSITGSIITSTILKPTVVEGEDDTVSDYVLQFCGVEDCPDANVTNPNLEDPDDTTVWTMLGIFIGVALLGAAGVSLIVDRLPKELRRVEIKDKLRKEIKDLLLSTLKHLRHKEQLILIPLTMYSGFEQAFYNAEFSKSYISCSLGIWMVGLVTIPYGIVNAIVSFTSGGIAKYIGRLPIFIAGLCVDLSIQITLMSWMPTPDESYVLYILAGMWGFTDGIWQTQINALYGSIFADESEAAFSNYRMWESFGFIIAFAYSSELCTSVKLYVITSVLAVGWIGYAIVEYMIRMKKVESKKAMNGEAAMKEVHTIDENGRMDRKYENPGYEHDSKF